MILLPRYRLLLADDQPLNRKLVSRRLANKGFDIVEADNGQHVLDLLDQQQFDLVLLDIMMPQVDGMTALRKIREKYSMVELPVIMVTAMDQSEDVVAALEAGANDYVTKPINFQILSARSQIQLSLKRYAAINEECLNTASHDLKKPVAVVGNIVETLLEEIRDNTIDSQAIEQALTLAAGSMAYMRKIIEDFLNLQAIGAGALKLVETYFDVNQLVNEVVNQNQNYAASKQISIQLQLDDELPAIRADHTRIMQVLDNLLGNAIKFSPADTTITITTSQLDAQILLEVIDQGPGLCEADLGRAFEKFARLSNKPTGDETSTGLGLAICKHMIESHQGTIGVRNNPDHGASFWFSLPIMHTA